MCGFFGIMRRDGSVPRADSLMSSATLLGHRGPDASGCHAGPGIGLAHTRLSFLDVDARANQPFWDTTHRYCLVFNGEIYNYQELRASLEKRGAVFRTGSDTEVLLQCLMQSATDATLASLRGMFAFAFFDSQEHSLLLARDRFGMKPLYYVDNADAFYFASEVKALRPWTTLAADPFSVAAYLMNFGGPTQGATMFRGLRSLQPGAMLWLRRAGDVEHRRFFRLPAFWDSASAAALARTRPRQLVDMLEERLIGAVESHQFADVPVGAFCSGGVDSSLLMAIAARSHRNLAVFHANVVGPWSELGAATRLAKHLRLDLHVVHVNESDIVGRFVDVMSHYEQPYTYHPNCTPLLMVAELARQSGVKGLLSGEGSDECFLGYPWLGRKRFVDAWFRSWQASYRFLTRLPALGPVLFPAPNRNRDVVRGLLSRREIEDDRAAVRALSNVDGRPDDRDRWTLDYLGHHLRTLLHRNDTMGMAASIEARFPFLDHDVVRLAVNLPASAKLRFSPAVMEKAHPFVRDKWIVRAVADRYIPRGLSQRIKIGFWTTAFERMKVRTEYFDDSPLHDLFELSTGQFREVLTEAGQDLRMRLFHLDVWFRVCVTGASREKAQSRVGSMVTISPA